MSMFKALSKDLKAKVKLTGQVEKYNNVQVRMPATATSLCLSVLTRICYNRRCRTCGSTTSRMRRSASM